MEAQNDGTDQKPEMTLEQRVETLEGIFHSYEQGLQSLAQTLQQIMIQNNQGMTVMNAAINATHKIMLNNEIGTEEEFDTEIKKELDDLIQQQRDAQEARMAEAQAKLSQTEEKSKEAAEALKEMNV